MKLGKLGVWAAMDAMTAAEGAAFAKRVEGWGYAALWLPESRGRNVLVHSSWLLANTTRLIVAPGIANIYARDPMAMVNGQRALAEQSGGRFLLGLGVSHVPRSRGCAAMSTASRWRRCAPISTRWRRRPTARPSRPSRR
jgi:alkanesulfonate monooxygenase SsuD/methylene tetrahydromethanopterin reductase-like flavin-dependent oxidoreductase (luciferase family)